MSPQEIFGLVLAIVLVGALILLAVGVSARAGRRRAASRGDSGVSPVLFAGAGDGGGSHCSPGDSGGSCDSGGGGGSD